MYPFASEEPFCLFCKCACFLSCWGHFPDAVCPKHKLFHCVGIVLIKSSKIPVFCGAAMLLNSAKNTAFYLKVCVLPFSDCICVGGCSIKMKPLRMTESRNWITLLTTSLAVCVSDGGKTESRGLAGDGRHFGRPWIYYYYLDSLYIELSRPHT